MRGSIAEDQGVKSNGRSEPAGKSGAGYKLRPSEESGRSAMTQRRATGVSGELRLGKLQTAVWLGLALGSIVGAYFIGFFSGRYVGFETARESSASGVAKLPVSDLLSEPASQNPAVVYDKLKSPAILRDPEAENTLKAQGPRKDTQGTVFDSKPLLDRIGEDASQPAKVQGDARAEVVAEDLRDAEELLGGESNGPEVIIGSDSGLSESRKPDSVRMLGTSKTDAPQARKSADALLDERLAKARTDTDSELGDAESDGELDAKTTSKIKEESVKPVETGGMVRKVVPPGYFAQVAAPKKLSEAEGIARRLKGSGFPVMIESASVAGESYYRVLVGPENNKVQADRLVSQLKSESYLSGSAFIRKVK